MKRAIIALALVGVLSGCGKSEAQKDYEKCNKEWADSEKCTREEFNAYLQFHLEDSAFMMVGGIENATTENYIYWQHEIDRKIEEIFE
ncbi:MAG: hypothetical protein ACQEWW_08615 [Bacillota bacterium]